MIDLDNPYLGIGIYSVGEAALLTHVKMETIRRWLRGYTYTYDGTQQHSPSVWKGQLPVIDGKMALGFRDLMEVRFVNAFREHNVSWKTIRLAAIRAKELFDRDHPFSTKSFKTDGKSIFAEIIEETGEEHLLDLVKSQYAFKQILTPFLYRGLEFDNNDTVVKWWPLGKQRRIVLDPNRSFGRPIVDEFGIPTSTLADAFRVERSYRQVAKWYEISEKSVRNAVEFQDRIAA